MKYYLLLVLIALMASSCGKSSNDFLGDWKPLSESVVSNGNIISIRKQDKIYLMTGLKSVSDTIILAYDAQREMLISNGEVRAEVSFINSTGHIIFLSNTLSEAIELKKAR